MSVIGATTCRHCGSDDLVKFGFAPNGKQKYRCCSCGRQSRENPGHNGYTPVQRAEILGVYAERVSLRGLERMFGVHRNTVTSWIRAIGEE